MGSILSECEQTVVSIPRVEPRPIAAVVFVGRQQGILAGPNGMMNRIVSAKATQPHTRAIRLASHSIVRRSAVQHSSRAVRQGQQQAHENDIDRDSTNESHSGIPSYRNSSQASVAFGRRDVERGFVGADTRRASIRHLILLWPMFQVYLGINTSQCPIYLHFRQVELSRLATLRGQRFCEASLIGMFCLIRASQCTSWRSEISPQ